MLLLIIGNPEVRSIWQLRVRECRAGFWLSWAGGVFWKWGWSSINCSYGARYRYMITQFFLQKLDGIDVANSNSGKNVASFLLCFARSFQRERQSIDGPLICGFNKRVPYAIQPENPAAELSLFLKYRSIMKSHCGIVWRSIFTKPKFSAVTLFLLQCCQQLTVQMQAYFNLAVILGQPLQTLIFRLWDTHPTEKQSRYAILGSESDQIRVWDTKISNPSRVISSSGICITEFGICTLD